MFKNSQKDAGVALRLGKPSPLPVQGNGELTRLGSLAHRYMVEVIGAHIDRPIKIEIMLVTTNEIAGLVVFWA